MTTLAFNAGEEARLERASERSLPQLLVSVRDSFELINAINGGADIVDLKEPKNGPLGCLLPKELRLSIEAHSAVSSPPPLSLAMGELYEWNQTWSDLQQEILRLVQANKSRIRFLKFGLSRCTDDEFPELWRRVATRVRRFLRSTRNEDLPLLLIPAVYADSRNAGGPSPEAVVKACREVSIPMLLIDTFTKDGTGLLGCLDAEKLRRLRAQILENELWLALAGQIGQAQLPDILLLQPNVIGVRGAVCEAGDRASMLSQTLVTSLKQHIAELHGRLP